MKTVFKESASFVADVTICFLFCVLCIVAWPFIDGDESTEEGKK